MTKWLKLIFLPWLVIRDERMTHENEISAWRMMVMEADPLYFQKKQMEALRVSPRTNFIIKGIDIPN